MIGRGALELLHHGESVIIASGRHVRMGDLEFVDVAFVEALGALFGWAHVFTGAHCLLQKRKSGTMRCKKKQFAKVLTPLLCK